MLATVALALAGACSSDGPGKGWVDPPDAEADTQPDAAACEVPVTCGVFEIPCPCGYVCTDGGHCADPAGEEIFVGGGDFWLGCSQSDKYCADAEKPQTQTTVPSFFIDRTEVTVAAWQACVGAGECSPAGDTPSCNAAHEDRGDHPINCVSWRQASEYCAWRGGELCSEQQWEKAARGGCALHGDANCRDTPPYPWGDFPAICTYAVMSQCAQDQTSVVGSKEAGQSIYGLMDLSGNVAEWVGDCWHESYEGAPTDGTSWVEEAGCASGRVARGGCYLDVAMDVRSGVRLEVTPTQSHAWLGFRCCRWQPREE